MSNNFRPVYEQPIYKIIIEVRDLSPDNKGKTAVEHPFIKYWFDD